MFEYVLLFFFRLMRPLVGVEARRGGSIALYVTIINCIDEAFILFIYFFRYQFGAAVSEY